MSEGRVTIEGYLGVALLAAVALIAVLTWGLATRPTVAPKPPHFMYGPRTEARPGPGVLIYCQDKWNSQAFAERKRAKPGDVFIVTCRAVKG